MAGYSPGEQPQDAAYLKLNTNESPYPPSPRVFEAVQTALTSDRLRKYPDAVAVEFRQAVSQALGVHPEWVLAGNGSDDILTIVTRAFVPEGGLVVSPTPSYLLYQSLAEIQGASFQAVPYTDDWDLPSPWPIRQAHLTFIASPNSPSGTVVSAALLKRLLRDLNGPLLLDEAYVDFAEESVLSLLGSGNVIVSRSLSKSYALAGIRFGFAIADPVVIRELVKVKDSYNCDVLSMVAATAAIRDQEYLRSTRAKIIATRERMTRSLRQLGFNVCDSQANFVWSRRADRAVRPLYEALKRRHILVRYMNYAGYGDGLRISVGSDAEIDRLLDELGAIL